MAQTDKEISDSFRQKCRQHGLSVTPQRSAIYKAVAKSDAHPTCEQVFKQVRRSYPDIAVDTVYRTLATFAEIGLITQVEGSGMPLRYDPRTVRHHHFRCSQCDKIIDFQDTEFDNLNIPGIIKRNHSVSNIRVILEGLCNKCKKK